jgi:hypothetical protein
MGGLAVGRHAKVQHSHVQPGEHLTWQRARERRQRRWRRCSRASAAQCARTRIRIAPRRPRWPSIPLHRHAAAQVLTAPSPIIACYVEARLRLHARRLRRVGLRQCNMLLDCQRCALVSVRTPGLAAASVCRTRSCAPSSYACDRPAHMRRRPLQPRPPPLVLPSQRLPRKPLRPRRRCRRTRPAACGSGPAPPARRRRRRPRHWDRRRWRLIGLW